MIEAKEAPKPAKLNEQPAPIKYFKCNQMGHHYSDCPFRKVVHLAEKEDGDDNEVCYKLDGYGDDDEVYEDDNDDGHNYVVRKLMLMPKQEESTQRLQLFRTRCTISGKLFELIIDNDSCENIISREAVKLLRLLVEKHPNPYIIWWIKAVEK